MILNLITPAASEPVIIADVENHCRLGSNGIATAGQKTAANIFIGSARRQAEAITRRQLITATWEMVLDPSDFPAGTREPVEIPMPPLQSITSVKYYDVDGVLQTLSASLYRVIIETGPMCQPGLVVPVYGQVWPSIRDDYGAVTIRFVAGYGTAGSSIPEDVRNWMLLNIGNLWENRETIVVSKGQVIDLNKTIGDGLLSPYIVREWV